MKSDISKIYPNNFLDLINEYGFMDPRLFLTEIRKYIKEIYDQDDLTFLDLSKKTGINLYISTTEANSGDNVIFNVDDYPNVSVIDAIAASMCIPVMSKPVLINGKYYVDGYLTNNFPIEVFNHINSEFILGVAVNTKKDSVINMDEISFGNYVFNILKIMFLLILTLIGVVVF